MRSWAESASTGRGHAGTGPCCIHRYTPDVPSQSVVHALAYVNWTVLLSLGVGSLALVVVLATWTDATRGFLGTTAVCAAILGVLAWVTDAALPPPDGLAIVPAPPVADTARRVSLVVFSAASALCVVALRRRAPVMLPGLLGIAAGILTMAIAAVGWTRDAGEAVPLLLQLVVLSAAAGGTLGALILGHWYLVTPKLGERPLILATRLLTGVLTLQLALFVTWAAFGTGTADGAPPFAVLTGGAALFVWLRLIVSLVGPLILSVMAERTARTRSMESATGLLYISLAAIASGTIVAAGLAYGSGILV